MQDIELTMKKGIRPTLKEESISAGQPNMTSGLLSQILALLSK